MTNTELAVCDYARPNEYALEHKHALLYDGVWFCHACGRTWVDGDGSKFRCANQREAA